MRRAWERGSNFPTPITSMRWACPPAVFAQQVSVFPILSDRIWVFSPVISGRRAASAASAERAVQGSLDGPVTRDERYSSAGTSCPKHPCCGFQPQAPFSPPQRAPADRALQCHGRPLKEPSMVSHSGGMGSMAIGPGCPSSYHEALDHFQSTALFTSPRRTGLR
jgi:hypothetical protein